MNLRNGVFISMYFVAKDMSILTRRLQFNMVKGTPTTITFFIPQSVFITRNYLSRYRSAIIGWKMSRISWGGQSSRGKLGQGSKKPSSQEFLTCLEPFLTTSSTSIPSSHLKGQPSISALPCVHSGGPRSDSPTPAFP